MSERKCPHCGAGLVWHTHADLFVCAACQLTAPRKVIDALALKLAGMTSLEDLKEQLERFDHPMCASYALTGLRSLVRIAEERIKELTDVEP